MTPCWSNPDTRYLTLLSAHLRPYTYPAGGNASLRSSNTPRNERNPAMYDSGSLKCRGGGNKLSWGHNLFPRSFSHPVMIIRVARRNANLGTAFWTFRWEVFWAAFVVVGQNLVSDPRANQILGSHVGSGVSHRRKRNPSEDVVNARKQNPIAAQTHVHVQRHGISTLLGCVAAIVVPISIVFFKYVGRIRACSKCGT